MEALVGTVRSIKKERQKQENYRDILTYIKIYHTLQL